jgi:hypothetical protein
MQTLAFLSFELQVAQQCLRRTFAESKMSQTSQATFAVGGRGDGALHVSMKDPVFPMSFETGNAMRIRPTSNPKMQPTKEICHVA